VARIYRYTGSKHRGRAERGLTVGRGVTVRPQARPRGIVARMIGAVSEVGRAYQPGPREGDTPASGTRIHGPSVTSQHPRGHANVNVPERIDVCRRSRPWPNV
jgi:hypothetical protein